MVPVKDIFDKFYKRGSKLRELLLVHSEAVAAKALDIARLRRLDLDPDHIYAGAMLHDVGIFMSMPRAYIAMGRNPTSCTGYLERKCFALTDNRSGLRG